MPGITGPAPKPDDQRRRRNAVVAMTQLPAEGRQGEPPRWPLVPDVILTTRHELAEAKVERLQQERRDALDDDRPVGMIERRLDVALEAAAITGAQLAAQRGLEAELWAEAWATPQAVVWDRLGWRRDVAQYVRHKALAELGDLDAAKEARQWSDRLGLTPLAMLRLRWAIAVDEVAARRPSASEPAPAKTARDRLRVVDRAVAGA